MAYAPTKRRMQRSRRPSLLVLNITSMLDMFTILIIFLLKSYSAEGIILPIPAELHIPYSTTRNAPEPGLVVEVTMNSLVVDGRFLDVDLKSVQRSDELLIEELYEYLMIKAAQYEQISSLNPNAGFTGQLVLEGDRDVPFRFLKKILYTCGQAGFINQSLAVYKKE
ncbi:MAG: biopolymer transporter ExbD [bacterium]|nr:biopolymer transporter ExbD [bacterium]